MRRQTELVEAEEANMRNPRHSDERRRHAEWAIAWAEADRELVARHEKDLLAALDRTRRPRD
ncbi:hypothetical protein [Micromonospora chersina]|uniref:hypothetical protein n=1 Tax=Micromonospora chersina TaxID=47854 RepID=UPI00371165E0